MSNESEESQLGEILTQEERDTISEMTSIAMGAAGSTLGILLGTEVDIPTLSVKEYATLAELDSPFGEESKTLVMVQYVKGLSATSVFIFKNSDIRKLAAMMLGSADEAAGPELTEMELGAAGELMNQMMNSAATSLASVIHEAVEINNPEVLAYSTDMLSQSLPQVLTEPFIASHIQMKTGVELPIEIMELRVASEVKAQVAKFMSIQPDYGSSSDQEEELSIEDLIAQTGMSPGQAAGLAGKVPKQQDVDPVMVRPVEFSSFDHQPTIYGEENKNLALVMDVSLNLSVELGKTELSIKEVLELTRGSVIELERVAGEPVDLMANGKLIAKGEVVVIEDNFGLRITSIVSPADRLKGL
jgi:flagellar motor switch protein FliN